MRDDLLQSIKDAAEDFPNLRLGQLLQNALEAANVSTPLYYVTDAELFAALQSYDPQEG